MAEQESRPGIERHFQTFVSTVAVAVMLWVGNTLNGLQTEFATVKQQVITSTSQLNAGMMEREALRKDVISLLIRVDRLEQQLKK